MKKRNILLLAVCALLVAAPSFGQKMESISGTGRYMSKNVENLPAFTAVDVRGDAEVDFVQSAAPSVTISGRENLVELLEVRVENDALVVEFSRPVHIRGEHHLRVAVAAPVLRSVAVTHGGEFELRGMLKAEDLVFSAAQDSEISADYVMASVVAVSATGRAEVELERLSADKVYASADDQAEISLSGSARAAFLTNNGAGDIDADDLHAGTAQVTVNASGDIKVYASKTLNATANGRGRIEYKGYPVTLKREGKIKKIRQERDDD